MCTAFGWPKRDQAQGSSEYGTEYSWSLYTMHRTWQVFGSQHGIFFTVTPNWFIFIHQLICCLYAINTTGEHWILRGRFQWPSCLRGGYAADRWICLRVRIPPGKCMSVTCECCVFSTYRSSSRGVLSNVVCHSVWSKNVKNEADLARVGLLRQS